jgi:hypothetical protein
VRHCGEAWNESALELSSTSLFLSESVSADERDASLPQKAELVRRAVGVQSSGEAAVARIVTSTNEVDRG